MQQIHAGMNELNEREQNAEARATEAERQAQATQQELVRSQAGVKRKGKGAAMPAEQEQGVRITAFSSAIVIDVIVPCHTAGALLVKVQKTIVPIIVWLGFDPFRPVQNHIGSGAGNSAIDTFVLDRDVVHHVQHILNCCYCFSSSTYGGDLSLCVDGTCIIAFSAQCTGL